jgi:hypothetical protein
VVSSWTCWARPSIRPTKPYTRTPRDFENKVIGLYFEAANNCSSDLFSALQELYDKNASSFELVYVSLCDLQEAYDQRAVRQECELLRARVRVAVRLAGGVRSATRRDEVARRLESLNTLI